MERQPGDKERDDTFNEIVTVNDLCLYFLATDIRCRNDDKYLTYRVMRHFTRIYIPFEDFNKIPAFETIKRCRAKIQNVMKLYLPTDDKVIARRSIRQRVFSNMMARGVNNG